MEDLWKLARIDYRLPPIAEQSAYQEIVRRYHVEECGSEDEAPIDQSDHQEIFPEE